MLQIHLGLGLIGDRGLTSINGELGLCATLHSLRLDDCDICDEGLLALCQPLANCTALCMLGLSRDKKSRDRDLQTMGDKGFVQLATHGIQADRQQGALGTWWGPAHLHWDSPARAARKRFG